MEKKKLDSGKLIEYLNEKWKGAKCPMCGAGSWTVSDNVFELREFNDGNLIVGGGPVVPIVPISCSNCGNSVLINGIIAGVVNNENKKEE